MEIYRVQCFAARSQKSVSRTGLHEISEIIFGLHLKDQSKLNRLYRGCSFVLSLLLFTQAATNNCQLRGEWGELCQFLVNVTLKRGHDSNAFK